MNGPMSMYKLKPVVHFPDSINITDTMYKMKNIYSSNINPSEETYSITNGLPNVLEQVNKLLKKSPVEVEELKKRQEAILKQLTYLKEQMLALREELGKKNSSSDPPSSVSKKISPSHTNIAKEVSWDGVIKEVVLHASPDSPPYSLLAINLLWPDVLRLQVTCHSHSSVQTLPPHLTAFSALAATPAPTLQVRLIWKQMGQDCELVISPLSHCAIRGEVNLLRYLYRTISTPSDDLLSDLKLDSTLDICHRLVHARTLRDKQLQVRALNARLGKSTWLGGEEMGIADLAAWSALRTVSKVDLSQNMSKWQSRCCAAIGVCEL
uniref:AIMP2 thioredoxin-like domain-containing protein n=2 Tax=Homalodisca liturata TaxID=320908 RepID=A0A1B6JPP6_9HEMI